MRKKKPIVILENVLVQDYAAEGKSLARVDGKVIFIENSIPGDVVDVQLHKNKKDWAEGWPVRVKKYSPSRIKPFCSHFGSCGGCNWQMLPYNQQLKYKQQQVYDNLTRIGRIQLPELMPIIGCESTIGYRNKMEYTFSTKRFIPEEEFKRLKAENPVFAKGWEEDGAYAGFHAKGMFDKVVNIDTCYLQDEPTNEMRKAIAEFGRKNNYSFYNIAEHHGFLRTMMVRIVTTGEIMLNIVFGYEDKAKREALLNDILEKFPAVTTLLYTINAKRNDSIFDLDPQVYKGKGYILEKLESFLFKISPKSFFQTNSRQAERLYQVTRDFAELDGTQVVYDLYCGTGSIGIFVSGQAKKIIGVEMIEEAIADAKENAALNKIEHASFYAGDVINICNDDFFEANGRPDVIITDPPRAGMHEKLVKKLLEIAAPTLVYVSCNPATQARDLQLLGEKYSVTKIQPVDMFPHTLHIENVVQLKLKASGESL